MAIAFISTLVVLASGLNAVAKVVKVAVGLSMGLPDYLLVSMIWHCVGVCNGLAYFKQDHG